MNDDRLKTLTQLNVILLQEIRINNTYSFLIKNRVSLKTRKKFKTVRNIILSVSHNRKNRFINN